MFMTGLSEGQPDSIVGDIENMVRSYIEKVNHHFQFDFVNAKRMNSYHKVVVKISFLQKGTV